MPEFIQYTPPNGKIEILYIDDDLIIVNKPAGLLSVPGRGDSKKDCLISRIQKKHPEALIVHRLDMPTSGILVLARSALVHKQLSKKFQQREVAKQYVAVVQGILKDSSGEIDLPLITDWPNRPKQKVDFESGKPSLTRYKVISVDHEVNTSRILLFPITGRSHQLRVHMLYIGHIIMGDELYQCRSQDYPHMNKPSRLLLHASKICFEHPTTQTPLSIECSCNF